MKDDMIAIEVDLVNEGAMTAEETIFLFIHDKVATVVRPVLELKGTAKALLAPGEQRTVRINLPAASLEFLGLELRPVFEPGEIEVFVGPSADRSGLLSRTIRIA